MQVSVKNKTEIIKIQLAQTLQGRFDQPLQAYVVSRDITNQQQLDLDIENNASFG